MSHASPEIAPAVTIHEGDQMLARSTTRRNGLRYCSVLDMGRFGDNEGLTRVDEVVDKVSEKGVSSIYIYIY